MTPDDGWIATAVNASGRLIIGFLDAILIAISLTFMTIGTGVFLLGMFGTTAYSNALAEIGAVVALGSLFILLCWGFSRRLSSINRQITRVRADLDELLRRTQP